MTPKLLRLALYLFAFGAAAIWLLGWIRPGWHRELNRAMRVAAAVLLLAAAGALGWHWLH